MTLSYMCDANVGLYCFLHLAVVILYFESTSNCSKHGWKQLNCALKWECKNI